MDPARLDLLLGVLGSEEASSYNGARCAQLIRWNPGMWESLKTRLGAADAVTGNPFMDTRLGIVLGRGQELPGAVEAVAAAATAASAGNPAANLSHSSRSPLPAADLPPVEFLCCAECAVEGVGCLLPASFLHGPNFHCQPAVSAV